MITVTILSYGDSAYNVKVIFALKNGLGMIHERILYLSEFKITRIYLFCFRLFVGPSLGFRLCTLNRLKHWGPSLTRH